MMRSFLFFVLASAFLFASCHCNNSNIDNGPRSEEPGLKEETGPKHEEKKEEPKFSLALADGVKEEDLFVNRPIPLLLKDQNFSKHDITAYKSVKQQAEKGVLHLMDANGNPGKRVESSDTIELKDGVFPLVFVPNGKAGKDTISLELTSFNKGDSFGGSLEVDLKSVISLEAPEEIKTGKLTTAWLKINADPEEEFTLKSVRIDHYPLEMTYDNGEAEGVWAEVKPVRIGDKFKAGEHELSLKLYGYNDKVETGGEVFEAVKFESYIKKVSLDLVLVDSKGNECKTEAKFDVDDISFELVLGDIEWGLYEERSSKAFKEGIFKFDFQIKFGNLGLSDGYNQYFKILSFSSNDGSAVSLLNHLSEDVVGQTLKGANLYFRFDQMNLDFVGKPTILTIKIQGPGGVVKSADLEIGADEREVILWKKIEWIKNEAIRLCNYISKDFSLYEYKWDMGGWGSYEPKLWMKFEAEKAGEGVVAFLEEVKFMGSQINPALLSKYFSPSRLKDIEDALTWINHLKGRLQDFNKDFGFNFVSPI